MTLAERCRQIEGLILDVDGTLTDGGIIYGETDTELKSFQVRDGAGLKAWLAAGKKAGIVTGRLSKVVDRRGRELGLSPVIQGARDKSSGFQEALREWGLKSAQVCVIGDDWPDARLAVNCGLAVAVADARAEMLRVAHYVTLHPGGRGGVRDAIELILRCQGKWNAASCITGS